MPKEVVPMRKIREVLRVCWACGWSERAAAISLSLSRSTVGKYLARARVAGLSWPLPEDLDDAALERRLFPAMPVPGPEDRFVPDWAQVHRELARKGVTLQLLWEEHKQAHPDGYQYSRFSELYRTWRGALDLPMRQNHKAGEKLFVDYCGQTLPITDRATGKVSEAQVFVAVLGASNYTYAEAGWTQSLPEWITAHVHAFAYLQGVPAFLIPDNLKAGVTLAHRYEPELNPTYRELAEHYGCTILPTRVRKPKDKAKVEKGVQDVEHRILAALRHRTFFTLAEANEAIARLLVQHNERPFQKMPGSRRTLFEALDKPALKPLPLEPYEYAEWQKARVNIDYHVAVEGHYYSVPYALVRREVEVRLTATVVEIFHKGTRIASHFRSHHKGQHSTVSGHMPKPHQQYLEWTPERLVQWAQKTGGETARAVETILSSRSHPQQGFRSCLGLMRLAKEYEPERLEAACARALALGSVSYKSVESILKKDLDKRPLPEKAPPAPTLDHDNIRGAGYYEKEISAC
jgi:transposase